MVDSLSPAKLARRPTVRNGPDGPGSAWSGQLAQHARAELLLALLAALDGLEPLGLARPGRPVHLDLAEEVQGDLGDVIHRVLASLLVGPGEALQAGELAHVLQRRGADFLFGRGGLEMVERLDIPA